MTPLTSKTKKATNWSTVRAPCQVANGRPQGKKVGNAESRKKHQASQQWPEPKAPLPSKRSCGMSMLTSTVLFGEQERSRALPEIQWRDIPLLPLDPSARRGNYHALPRRVPNGGTMSTSMCSKMRSENRNHVHLSSFLQLVSGALPKICSSREKSTSFFGMISTPSIICS